MIIIRFFLYVTASNYTCVFLFIKTGFFLKIFFVTGMNCLAFSYRFRLLEMTKEIMKFFFFLIFIYLYCFDLFRKKKYNKDSREKILSEPLSESAIKMNLLRTRKTLFFFNWVLGESIILVNRIPNNEI